jgi:hypothetical protein
VHMFIFYEKQKRTSDSFTCQWTTQWGKTFAMLQRLM